MAPFGRRLKKGGAAGAVGRGLYRRVASHRENDSLHFVHRFAQGAGRKVLRIDRPAAGGFLSLTAFQAEGCGIALRAMSINSALRIHLSVSYGMIGIL